MTSLSNGHTTPFFKNPFRPHRSLERERAKPRPRRRDFLLEPLESRLLLSVDLVGAPSWVPEGPAPIINAGSSVAPNHPATGAVESAAVNPNNPRQIYVGSVNGGVWRTDNADPNNTGAITWTPLTDPQQSLAMGSIAYSPLDLSGNTLFVGTGSFSNLAQAGGPAIGVLRTTDGGAAWQTFPLNPAGNEPQVKTVLPTRVNLSPGPGVQEMVLVGTLGGGLFRSDDTGQTYTPISGINNLPNGSVTQLIADPNNVNQFYAAVAQQGVFQGVFNPVTKVINWTAVNTAGLTNAATSNDIQIAANSDGVNTTIFALVVGSAPGNQGAFRSVNGGNWTALAQPPGIFANPNVPNQFFPGPGQSGFFIATDPTNSQVAYITGYSSGTHVFRYDPSGAGSWVAIMGATSPHADGRSLIFLNNTTLIETDDGGIYSLSNPITATAATANWQSLIGETVTGHALGDVETHDIAWDSNSSVIVGGAQDNGTSVQQTTGNSVWTALRDDDGGDVLVDNFTLAGSNQSIRYFSSQNFGGFSRQTFDTNNNPVGGSVGLIPAAGLTGFVGQFVTPTAINAIAPTAAQIAAGQSTRIVIGGGTTAPGVKPPITAGAVYESNNAGVAANAAAVTWAPVPTGAGFTGAVTALAYGGRRNGVDNPDALYVGANGLVFVRAMAGGTLTATATPFPGGNVRGITLDPTDWQHAFVASSSGVWETTDMGATWTNRTGNLTSLTSNLQTIEFAGQGAVAAILVGGQGGVFRMITNNPGLWGEFGAGLPNTVTYDLDYNAASNILVAGTLGRGAWTVNNANKFLTTPGLAGVLQINGDTDFVGEDDTIKLVVEPTNNSLLDVFLNNVESQFKLSTIQQINVNGLGGNDTLIMDDSNGLINVPLGTRYDGGTGFNRLEEVQTGGPTWLTDTYKVGPLDGSGISKIVGAGSAGTQKVFFQNLAPVIDLVPVGLLTVDATPASNAIAYTSAASPTQGRVTIDNQEWIKFSNKTLLVVNTLAGTDTIGINNPNTPTGLIGITINGGDPSAGDTLNVTGVGATVNGVAVNVFVDTAMRMIMGATGTAGAVPISYSNIAFLNLPVGIGALTLTTTAADDTVVVTPGLTTGTNSGTLKSNGATPQISFANNGDLNLNLDDGSNALVVNGSQSGDTINVDGAAVAISGRHRVNYNGVQALTVNGGGGSDRFIVAPSVMTAMFIDGGPPIGNGDMLFVISPSGFANFYPGPQTDQGSYVVFGDQPVSFDHIESSLIVLPSEVPDPPSINLASAGTVADPILQFQNGSGSTLLTLRNYTNANTLTGLGLDGTDTSNITTAARSWGLPSGKEQPTDNLAVLDTLPPPRVTHSTATQDPDAGLVNYGMADFLAQYSDIKQVVISKA